MVPMSINIKSIILPKHPHLVSYLAPAPKSSPIITSDTSIGAANTTQQAIIIISRETFLPFSNP